MKKFVPMRFQIFYRFKTIPSIVTCMNRELNWSQALYYNIYLQKLSWSLKKLIQSNKLSCYISVNKSWSFNIEKIFICLLEDLPCCWTFNTLYMYIVHETCSQIVTAKNYKLTDKTLSNGSNQSERFKKNSILFCITRHYLINK